MKQVATSLNGNRVVRAFFVFQLRDFLTNEIVLFIDPVSANGADSKV